MIGSPFRVREPKAPSLPMQACSTYRQPELADNTRKGVHP
jgi:hypothetical protein